MNRIAVLAAALSLAACGGADDDAQASTAGDAASTAPAATAAPAATTTPAAPAVTDPQIAAIVVAANQVDIDAGNLAK
ncbi:MAG TPA: hypothetical protein VGX50_08485, partial [Longimicrobium sp.]|nr:hypothetical protein [Longimicrobium sp.]